jgi:transcriptional regulator with XRE-family HTH domain
MQTPHPLKVLLQNRWPRMSQSQLARRLDMNESLLSHYLAGRRTPPDGFYAAAAAVLECDPDDIRPPEPVAA